MQGRKHIILAGRSKAALDVLERQLASRSDFVCTLNQIVNGHTDPLHGVAELPDTLVLRMKLEGNPRFVDFLGHVKEVTLGAYAHQSLPFEYLVDELAPERDLSRHPLFQVFFALNNNPGEPFELPGLTLSGFAGQGVMSKFDLEMSLVEIDDRLKATLIYNPDLFDSSTIIQILEHYELLLQAVVEQPLCRLLDLPFGSEQENEAAESSVFQNADEFVFDF